MFVIHVGFRRVSIGPHSNRPKVVCWTSLSIRLSRLPATACAESGNQRQGQRVGERYGIHTLTISNLTNQCFRITSYLESIGLLGVRLPAQPLICVPWGSSMLCIPPHLRKLDCNQTHPFLLLFLVFISSWQRHHKERPYLVHIPKPR